MSSGERIDHGLAELFAGFWGDLSGFAFVAAFGVDFGRRYVADKAICQTEYKRGSKW